MVFGTIFGSVKNQLRSVIQWDNPDADHLLVRWTERGDEIKNASKLIVGPGQGVIFVYEGKVQAVHLDEGIYELKTANTPFLTTLSKYMQAFESEHKVALYFFRTGQLINQKWGTPSVIKYVDPVYKFPVGLRAFGNFSFQIRDPQGFLTNITAGSHVVTVDAVRQKFVARMLSPMGDFLAEAKFSYNDIDANRMEIAEGVIARCRPDFVKLGFEILDFRIEGTSFDEDTTRRIGRISDMSAEAQAAAAAGVNFAQLQQLEAMRDAAKNPGSAASAGVGIGAGMGLGQMMAGAMSQNNASAGDDPMAKLQKLKQMLDAGLITAEEFAKKKEAILATM